MRDIPAKNYFIIGFIAVAVIIISLVLRNMYIKNNGQIKYVSPVKEIVNEIRFEDLDDYLQESPNCVLYINDSSKKNKSIQKDTKKIILDNGIQQYVVYIEKTDAVIKKYDLNTDSPIFVAYQNGVLTEILSKDSYTAKEIESFFIRNKVIDND